MKKETKKGIIIMLLCTLFTALGQLFFKYSSSSFEWNALKLITNYSLILGLLCYGLGAILMIIALRYGNLSTIYPVVSLTFVWVIFISVFIFNTMLPLTGIINPGFRQFFSHFEPIWLKIINQNI